MGAWFCMLSAVLVLVSVPDVALAQRLLFLVRHAQKDQELDALTDQGRSQAATLAQVLKDAGITSVYVSQFHRTEQTAEELLGVLESQGVRARKAHIPLSDDLLADPESETALAAYAEHVVSTLETEANEEIVLLVGHDITVPAIAEKLGGRRIKFERNEFTHLLIVVPKSGGRGSGMVHIPDYTLLRTTFVGEPRSSFGEAVQSAIDIARQTTGVKNTKWSFKEVAFGTEGYAATISVSNLAIENSPTDGTTNRKFFEGSSARGDFNEAVQNAVTQALADLPTDTVAWRLLGAESNGGELSVTLAVTFPPMPEEPRPNISVFTGTSNDGDVYEAMERAVEDAKTALEPRQVHLEITQISGTSGGFANAKTVRVSGAPKSKTADPPIP
jgi:broad specificity phosphatase PhoE